VAYISDAAANAEAGAFAPLLNAGFLSIYAGTRPSSANNPLGSGNILLATFQFSTVAFGAPVGGVLTANAITAVGAIVGTGIATFARCTKQDAVSVVVDYSVGATGLSTAEILFQTTSFIAGAMTSIPSLIHNVVEIGP
jgi:hypothetical protein